VTDIELFEKFVDQTDIRGEECNCYIRIGNDKDIIQFNFDPMTKKFMGFKIIIGENK
jgi:hypothetical protein